ncbi:MAG: hypothetical protein JO022_08625 [Acidobacteriaceae bacterium]|nr:hypothetical protein [Acidobacteriaceae bacterium]
MDKLAHLAPIIERHASQLKQPGVVSIHPGYTMKDGWPTETPAIVVTTSKTARHLSLPQEVDGVPIDVRRAAPIEEWRFEHPELAQVVVQHRPELRGGAFPSAVEPAAQAVLPTAIPEMPYTPPAGVTLHTVTGTFPITCHVSPDAGWPTLKGFLAATKTSLTVSMYDFTSKHVLDGVTGSLQSKQSLEITLDHPSQDASADQSDPQTIADLATALGNRFESAWALVQTNTEVTKWIFPSAYHIKVAVRDSSATWLSSGNWNNTNQPDMDPINHPQSTDQATARKSDRDWHVIIENADVSAQFEAFMKHDFDVAKLEQVSGASPAALEMPEELQRATTGTFIFHAPLRIAGEQISITPLLTPDPGVYRGQMLQLIQSAQARLYIQLQYIHPPNTGVDQGFTDLINAVAAKIRSGVDVRIILSQYQTLSGWLDRLQSAGISLSAVKIQTGVHNKGFVVDSKTVVVSSQNWSGDGVLRNRDAGVIIESQTAAKYYESIFLHDWTRIAKQSVNPA